MWRRVPGALCLHGRALLQVCAVLHRAPPSPALCQIYTGNQCKVSVRQQMSVVKVASMERDVNAIVMRIVGVLGAVCLIGAVCSVAFVSRAHDHHTYLGFDSKPDAADFFQVCVCVRAVGLSVCPMCGPPWRGR